MIKNTKKFIAAFLALIMIFSALSISASAFSSDQSTIKDSEIMTFDGISYRIEEISLNGMEVTRVINLSTNTQEIIYFDESIGTLFSNGEPVAYVEEIKTAEKESLLGSVSPLTNDPYWSHAETKYYKVTWAQGASIAVVAGVIAAVLPGKGKIAVIAAIGIGALGDITSSSIGGTIKLDLYRHVIPQAAKIELLYEWSFITPTGETYGPFSYMQT